MHIEGLDSRRPGGIVSDVDLRSLDAGDVAQIKNELARHGMLAFRKQALNPADLVRLAKLFGEIEPSTREQYWLPSQPEIYVISNIVENGRNIGNPNDGFQWHTDQYYFERPTAYTFLYGIEVPPQGADTMFCETYSMYDKLTAAERERFSQLHIRASHSKLNAGRLHAGQEERFPDQIHPLVCRHPLTGRKFLFFSSKLSSMPHEMDEAEFKALHDRLLAEATDSSRVYAHKWQKDDMIIWDNRGLLHTATNYDKERDRRLCYRISVIGDRPTQ